MIEKLISGFNALKELLISGFEKVLEFFEFLLDFLGSILDFLLSWFGSLWNKLLELVADLISPLGDMVISTVPDLSSYWASHSLPGEILGYANTWVDLDLAASLLVAWFTWMLVFVIVKLSIKLLVPGLG